MNKKILLTLSVLLLSSLLLVGCQANQADVQPPTAPAATIANAIVAEGKLLPAQTVELSFFPTGGKIENVFFKEGDQVSKGATLANLVITPQQLAAVSAAEEKSRQCRECQERLFRSNRRYLKHNR